jgi:hydroxymethylpyrimidine/phosphomethylpyrimidine kinase
VLAPVALGDYDTLVAALLPCYWIYLDLGTRLASLAHAGHPYASWLATYSDPAFDAVANRAIEIVTARAARADEPTRARMWAAFRTSCEWELAFFEAPIH